MRGALIAGLCAVCCTAAQGQTGPMPATEVVKDAYVTDLAGSRIRVLYENVGQPFLFELQDRDVGQLFSYGYPPQGAGISEADMVVTLFEGWGAARDFYISRNLNRIAEALPVAGEETNGAFMNVSTLTTNDGRPVRFYSFMRTVNGITQDERCMARLLIDDTYIGAANGSFDSTECSDLIQ